MKELLSRLRELAIRRKESLDAWYDLDAYTCLWCGGEDMGCRELRIRGHLKLDSPKWFDLHNTGFPGYGTVICKDCLIKLKGILE